MSSETRDRGNQISKMLLAAIAPILFFAICSWEVAMSENTKHEEATVRINVRHRSDQTVNPMLYGKFCEHLGRNIYHGMEAQILMNCTFSRWRFSAGDNHPDGGVREESDPDRIKQAIHHAARDLPEVDRLIDSFFDGCAFGWFRLGDKKQVRLSPDVGPHGGRAQRIEILESASDRLSGIGQWTFLPLHRTRGYEYRIVARAVEPVTVTFSVGSRQNPDNSAFEKIEVGSDWETYTGKIILPEGVNPDDVYLCALTSSGRAHLVIDRILLYPDDHVNGADPEIIRLLRDSHLQILRWPGGNFVSGYHWRDGVGPVDERPTVPNPAWGGMEFNLFGTDEFIAFCREVGCEPMICVNAGDGTPEEAAAWVEYCNGSVDTPMGRLRAENGNPEPFNVKYWEIGNEIYGRWQVKWTTPDGNVDRYQRFSRAMLAVDPSIKLLGCGMGNSPISEWNETLIDRIGSGLRSITDHILTGGSVNADTDPIDLYHAFMGYPTVLRERYAALHDRMKSAGIEDPKMAITELQLFAHFRGDVKPDGKLSPHQVPTPDTIAEALSHAMIVNTCIRLGDFVELLTHSATVNHGGGLRKIRERVYANPIYYGRSMGFALASGTPVDLSVDCPKFSTAHSYGHIPPMRDVPAIDAMAVLSPNGDLIIMLIHRSATAGKLGTTIHLDGFSPVGAEASILAGETWYDRNTPSEPDKIVPRDHPVELREDGIFVILPPFSMVRITVTGR